MSDLASNVYDIIAKNGRVDRSEIRPEAKLADLKIESLDVVEIVFSLEEKFGIEIPFDAAQPQVKFETVADVVTAVEGLVAAKKSA